MRETAAGIFFGNKDKSMKKVYFSKRITIIFGIFFSLCSWAGLKTEAHDFHTYLVIAGMGFIVLYFLYLNIVPFIFYDESGIKAGKFKGLLKKSEYAWSEVTKIFKNVTWPGGDWVYMQDGSQFSLNSFLTKDYSKVMADMICYVRKNNPRAEIDVRILKKVEKYL
jgi:hypothetical protein